MRNARQLCIAILFITAICGLAGGIVLIQDPSGHSLRMLTDNLRGTPFIDYSVPGWILLIAIGGFSALAAIVSLTHHKSYPYLMMTEGAILFIWILIQIEMIRELNFLQFVFALFGVALFLLGNLIRRSKKHGSGPSQHFKRKQQHY